MSALMDVALDWLDWRALYFSCNSAAAWVMAAVASEETRNSRRSTSLR